MKKFSVLPFTIFAIFAFAGCRNDSIDHLSSSGFSQSEESDSNEEGTSSLTYERNEEGYTVTGVSENVENIIIPSKYEGLPVTAIGDSAFAYSRHTDPILSITLPDSITRIGRNAFYNRNEMTTVTIGQKSQLKEIDRNAFSGNHALTNIHIPATLSLIGDSAFNNDGSINFDVDEANEVYSGENGHLIEKETKTLVRGGQSPTIPEGVLQIAEASFRKSNLTEISIPLSVGVIENYVLADSSVSVLNYEGNEEEWNAIEKAKSWNYRKKDIEVKFANNASSINP